MDFFQAVVLGIVEGVTEFLPISSTGHLILVADLLNIPETEFVKTFEIFIQLGAILAIVVLFFKKYFQNIKVWKNVLLAFIPTAIVGLLLYKVIKDVLLGNSEVTVTALLLGGVALILIELLHKEKDQHTANIEDLSMKQSLLIGFAQSLSIIPGVSRAAATIIGAMLLGTKRKTAVEFSFLLAVPTMLAATGLDLVKTNFRFGNQELGVLGVGFLTSFIVALIVVKWFISYVQKNNFIYFGVYRIIVSILFWMLI